MSDQAAPCEATRVTLPLELSLTVRGAPHRGPGAPGRRPDARAVDGRAGAMEAQAGTPREPARPIVPDDLPDELLEAIADAIRGLHLEGLL